MLARFLLRILKPFPCSLVPSYASRSTVHRNASGVSVHHRRLSYVLSTSVVSIGDLWRETLILLISDLWPTDGVRNYPKSGRSKNRDFRMALSPWYRVRFCSIFSMNYKMLFLELYKLFISQVDNWKLLSQLSTFLKTSIMRKHFLNIEKLMRGGKISGRIKIELLDWIWSSLHTKPNFVDTPTETCTKNERIHEYCVLKHTQYCSVYFYSCRA